MAKGRKTGGRRSAKKVVKNIPYGQAHIYATFNNTIVSMTDQSGMLLHGQVLVHQVSTAAVKVHLMLHV